jgi:hypothetical protein
MQWQTIIHNSLTNCSIIKRTFLILAKGRTLKNLSLFFLGKRANRRLGDLFSSSAGASTPLGMIYATDESIDHSLLRIKKKSQ